MESEKEAMLRQHEEVRRPIADDDLTPAEADALWRKYMRHKVRDFLPPLFPRTVCLCGSTRFMEAFYDANMRETLAGRIVLTVGMSSKGDRQPTEGQKVALDALHFHKIELADEVLVLNVGGYIGDSTRREIAYAKSLGKPVRYLEPEAKE